jgi:hypothetical protein
VLLAGQGNQLRVVQRSQLHLELVPNHGGPLVDRRSAAVVDPRRPGARLGRTVGRRVEPFRRGRLADHGASFGGDLGSPGGPMGGAAAYFGQLAVAVSFAGTFVAASASSLRPPRSFDGLNQRRPRLSLNLMSTASSVDALVCRQSISRRCPGAITGNCGDDVCIIDAWWI